MRQIIKVILVKFEVNMEIIHIGITRYSVQIYISQRSQKYLDIQLSIKLISFDIQWDHLVFHLKILFQLYSFNRLHTTRHKR